MTIFEAVKSTVTPKMAAEHFGLSVSRNGMVCCPFHDDRHPSMKLPSNLNGFAVNRIFHHTAKLVCQRVHPLRCFHYPKSGGTT